MSNPLLQKRALDALLVELNNPENATQDPRADKSYDKFWGAMSTEPEVIKTGNKDCDLEALRTAEAPLPTQKVDPVDPGLNPDDKIFKRSKPETEITLPELVAEVGGKAYLINNYRYAEDVARLLGDAQEQMFTRLGEDYSAIAEVDFRDIAAWADNYFPAKPMAAHSGAAKTAVGGTHETWGKETQGEESKFKAASEGEGNVADPGTYDKEAENHTRNEMGEWAQYSEDGVSYDPAGNYLCGTCDMRMGNNECMRVEGPISFDKGSCRMFHLGEPENKPPMKKKFSKEEARYAESNQGGFGCHRCEYGAKAKQPDEQGRESWCSFWGAHIVPTACCAEQELVQIKSAEPKSRMEKLLARNPDALKRRPDYGKESAVEQHETPKFLPQRDDMRGHLDEDVQKEIDAIIDKPKQEGRHIGSDNEAPYAAAKNRVASHNCPNCGSANVLPVFERGVKTASESDLAECVSCRAFFTV